MKISIIHPSRQRPQQAAKTAYKWLSSAKDKSNIEYLIGIDVDDSWQDYDKYSLQYGVRGDIGIIKGENKSAIDAINYTATFTNGDLLIVVSDDFDCPFHWDDALLTMLKGKEDFIVKTGDNVTNRHGKVQGQPWIITLPIMDRKYYERFGYVYYPGYQHMFCDTEMTHVTDLLGRKITLPINFPHNHYSANGAPDEVSKKADKTWMQGEALYLERLKNNFGLKREDIKGVLQCGNDHLQWLRSKGVPLGEQKDMRFNTAI